MTGAWAQEWTNIIVNSDLEGTDVSCFYKQESNSGVLYLCRITDGIGVDGSRGIMVQSQATDEEDWWTQFDIRLPYALPKGTQYKLSFDYKASAAGDFKFQISNEPGQYVWWTLDGWPAPGGSFDTTWKHYEQTFTVPNNLDGTTKFESGDWLMTFRTIYACLAKNKVTTQFIFDNIKVEIPSDVLSTLTPQPVTDPNLLIPAPPYTVSLAEGTEDAAKGTITPAEATTTGVDKDATVTLNYTGKKKIKAITAATIDVTPTANANEWTFDMPAYDVVVNVEYDTKLALSEESNNATALEEWDGFEADVTLTRTLQTGGWNTLALPFSISAANYAALQGVLTAQGGSITVKQLSSSSFNEGALTLNFADATSIEAGKPYLVKVSKALDLATLPAAIDAYAAAKGLTIVNPFKSVEVSKTAVPTETDAVDFIPTLGLTEVTGDTKEILFIGAGNKLLHPTELPDNMKGFRAYFLLKGDAANASSFSLNFGDGETTGIQTIDNGQWIMNSTTCKAAESMAQPRRVCTS